jgi:hypothetical protein
MGTEPKCEHGFKSPLSCVDCMNEGNLPPVVPEKLHVVFVCAAKYVGHCRLCDFTWGLDTEIAKLSDETYVHNKCALEAGL